jgi:hypothetical protein
MGLFCPEFPPGSIYSGPKGIRRDKAAFLPGQGLSLELGFLLQAKSSPQCLNCNPEKDLIDTEEDFPYTTLFTN